MSGQNPVSLAAGDLRQLSMLADRGSLALTLVRQGVTNSKLIQAGIEFCDALLSGLHLSADQLDMNRLSRQVAVLVEQTEPTELRGLSSSDLSSDLERVKAIFTEIISENPVQPGDLSYAQQVLSTASLPFYLADRDILRAAKERNTKNVDI